MNIEIITYNSAVSNNETPVTTWEYKHEYYIHILLATTTYIGDEEKFKEYKIINF